MKNLPAIVNLGSGIVFSVLFLLQILFFIFNYKRRYKNSLFIGMLNCGANIIAYEPFLALYAFWKSSDSDNHLATDDIAVALFAVLSIFWTIYAFFRLSKNVEE
jgi:hypothetical protein